jgi:hypothetical protein
MSAIKNAMMEDVETLQRIKNLAIECEKEIAKLHFKKSLVTKYVVKELETVKSHVDFDIECLIPKTEKNKRKE